MPFRFPCYRELKQQLGEFDALCECIEVATLDLVSKVSRGGPDSSIAKIAERYSIRVNTLSPLELRTHVARLYLSTVHQCLEEFLITLRKEHPDGDSWDMNGDDDRLTKTARAIGFTPTLSFDLCQHYRAIRNATMHTAARSRRETGTNEELRARTKGESSFCKLAAPNAYEDVTFDDFVLHTRCGKTLAAELCEAARPSDEELSRLAIRATSKLEMKLLKNPERLKKARSGFLRTQYSLEQSEADRIAEAC